MKRIMILLFLLGACSGPAPQPPPPVTAGNQPGSDANVPDYAKRPDEPFSRTNAIAIAEREWRAFGSPVNDAAPGPDAPVETRLDRQPGMWQRVGDYWWFSQDAYSSQSGWTGRYNESGTPYSGKPPAWSAAFISYVMRAAGAGDRFPYSPLHSTYINAAARGNPVLQAQPPSAYAPQTGDLICYGRRGAERLHFEDLPARSFFGHCDIVVEVQPGVLSVIGGNVSAGVTMKHVPVTEGGTLAGSDGSVLDDRYPWFVVLRVLYDAG